MIYPKIYAVYKGHFRVEVDGFVGFINNGSVYRFETDDGEIIDVCADYRFSRELGRQLGRSGHTPRKVSRQAYNERLAAYHKKRPALSNIMPVGTRVKLYKRDDRWMYRHLGE